MDSYDSSLNKSMGSKSKTCTQEESGWTSYFEDFLSNQRLLDQKNTSSCTSHLTSDIYFGTTSSSNISDAASCFVQSKPSSNENCRIAVCSSADHGLPNFYKKLNFKKTRTGEIYRDDSLEDTASSPVSSPKVGSFKKMDINQRKRDENCEISLSKGGGMDHGLELERDGRSEMVFEGNNIGECEDLRKRGMCLVPLTMLINYHG